MWSWVVIVALYATGLLLFQLLGGLSSAASAIQQWGRRSSEHRREEIEARLRARR